MSLASLAKHGQVPSANWVEEFLADHRGPHLLHVPYRMPSITEAEVLELLPQTGVLLPEETRKFMDWYREHALFPEVTRCMYQSSVNWAFEYIPSLGALAMEVTLKLDAKRKVIYVADLVPAASTGIVLGERILTGHLNATTATYALRSVPAEIGVAMLALKKELKTYDLDLLKKKSWTYWSAKLFEGAPKTQNRRQ